MIDSTYPILYVKNITKSFNNKLILNNISVNINKGDIKVLIGPSGAGKSTFLQCLNCLILPDSGGIYLYGDKIDLSNHYSLSELRKKVGMIFQDFNLFDHLTTEENISIALRKVANYSYKAARERALEELAQVGLIDKANLYPAQLSGGQKQRLAIARALAMEPNVMLLDEPTSALDPKLTCEVLTVIQKLANNGMTMVITTHQMDFACAIATDILFMEHGEIVEQGSPCQLLSPEAQTRTNGFFKSFISPLQSNSLSIEKPSISMLLSGDLSHDLTNSGTESISFPEKNEN
ncbi:amino acid ABC transporter ATP-binding protein [Lawsonia intracellularis]|uniref:ABC-type polar amino acid transport system, ATPase component n=1 Tax=Lawsonia intracellularis (strain PHE/MN1-00) TaxID=363253 RepID=Q1MQF5_LAWIP|nr:amino acid ABC transporter ATP-binding protein [Lawsonia intracellularis]AGC50140.1 ABC-type polar amino acid transport system, ATPase component [Lawsonia intracellularis N343]KAA0204835.1 amino acid ABC transporter ATP-binding protein [Lawsonia intracellularis]MBZ3892579.1 amino acid ABC transporter ATP-binding protein [Lawsonia intracellularis]OMQ03203.1 ABC transporter [Lawsonia intracellularis]RBN33250.1 amino acid ABC transporter ATP-binding protein [Lawsonia intracellularis]